MIIDSHAHYNNNAYRKSFLYLTLGEDGYALREGGWERLFQELQDAFAKTPEVVAIGECGLDYHYKREEQHRLVQHIVSSIDQSEVRTAVKSLLPFRKVSCQFLHEPSKTKISPRSHIF